MASIVGRQNSVCGNHTTSLEQYNPPQLVFRRCRLGLVLFQYILDFRLLQDNEIALSCDYRPDSLW